MAILCLVGISTVAGGRVAENADVMLHSFDSGLPSVLPGCGANGLHIDGQFRHEFDVSVAAICNVVLLNFRIDVVTNCLCAFGYAI